MATEVVVLNTGSSVSDDEVRELDAVLNPAPEGGEGEGEGAGAGEGAGDEVDLEAGDGAGEGAAEEERSGRVDQELEDAPDEAAREAIRARRRNERHNKRTRARERLQMLERQVADGKVQRAALEQRLINIERQNVGSQLAQFQQAEAQANAAEADLQTAIENATKAQDGATVAKATAKLIQLQAFKTQIQTGKAALEQQVSRPPARHLDPAMVENANNFRKENPWYGGTNATDEHSRIVSAIDAQLFSEGWDPNTPAYWEELKTRGAKYLPDRFNKGGAPAKGGSYNSGDGKGSGANRRSPVAGSGGSQGSSQPGGGARRTAHISAARVEAIKEAGMWDDPVQRKKMIEEYATYDKQHAKS
jgi:hypothetical protein